MKRSRRRWLTLLVVLVAAWAVFTDAQGYSFKLGKDLVEVKVKQGLDLQGGSEFVYEADFTSTEKKQGKALSEQDKKDAMDSLRTAVERRVNALGTNEPIVQTVKAGNSYRLIVELAGEKDPEKARTVIGTTAELEFMAQGPDGSWQPTGLTGKQLKRAQATFSQAGQPIVLINFDGEGAKLFSLLTAQNVGKPIGIFLDGQLVSAPNVQQQIADGTAEISGQFTVEETQQLAIQLNSGALPVPIKPLTERVVGPSLGAESVQRSIVAGILGLAIVSLFMIFYYRLPGLIAVVALTVYAAITFAVFKGGTVVIPPITFTLAGVAGFILSIGMAVDANILIFERLREELRAGRLLQPALEAGFKRAWTSIRDSNVATMITAIILYEFGTGPIRGFALTLAIGVAVSMFSAITVSRVLLSYVLRPGLERRLWLFGIRPDEVTK